MFIMDRKKKNIYRVFEINLTVSQGIGKDFLSNLCSILQKKFYKVKLTMFAAFFIRSTPPPRR